mgnify:CR=1 FL=1
MKKRALITGITGQDGSYLAEFLLAKGYEVHGVIRRSSSFNTSRIEHLYMEDLVRDIHTKKIQLHYGDLGDATGLIRLIGDIQPDEIYNLGAMSHVKVSFDIPEYTADTDGIDGSEDNAGALLTPDSLQRAARKHINAAVLLDCNDAYGFFEATGDLIVTGPTRTNVNDYRVILIS